MSGWARHWISHDAVTNYREDAEENQMISEQSSFDEEKAFDSTSKPLREWSWRRLGVPREVARRLAHMDVDGTTVAKPSFAQAVWALPPYTLCGQTRLNIPRTL